MDEKLIEAMRIVKQNGYAIRELPKTYIHKFVKKNGNEIYRVSGTKLAYSHTAQSAYYFEIDPKAIKWVEYDPSDVDHKEGE